MPDDDRAQPPLFAAGPSSSSALNQLGFLQLFCKTRDSNESDIDGVAVVISKDYTITTGGRRYRLEGSGTLRSATIGPVSLRLHVNGDQVQRRNSTSLGAGNDLTLDVKAPHLDLDPGDYTFQLVAGRGGDGDNLVTCLADGPDGDFGESQLELYDIGPQPA